MNRAKSGKKKQRDLLHTLCQRTTTTYSGILFITANTPQGLPLGARSSAPQSPFQAKTKSLSSSSQLF